MTSSTAKVQSSGPSLIFTSEAAPDHAGIPFINGFPLALEESVAGFLDHEQVIDLAASKDSPLKDNLAIQRTADIWRKKEPKKSANRENEIKNLERAAEVRAREKLIRIYEKLAEVAFIASCVFAALALLSIIIVTAFFTPMLWPILAMIIPVALCLVFGGVSLSLYYLKCKNSNFNAVV